MRNESSDAALDSFARAFQSPRMGLVVRLRERGRRSPRSRWSIKQLFHAARRAWADLMASLSFHFPPEEPHPSPPLAKAAALREGALLSEHVDARSNSRVA